MSISSIWKQCSILLAVALTGMITLTTAAADAAAMTPHQTEAHQGDHGQGKHDDNEHGKAKGKDKDKDKEKPDKGKNKPIAEVEEYAIEVDCLFDDAANSTTCTFAGVTPEGGKKINYVILARDAVCADVVGGDFDDVDPDPQTGVSGFRSRGSSEAFSLVLDGDVRTSGSSTYWIKAANNVFPATGPGLTCSETADEASTPQTPDSEATAATSDDTGSVIVTTYTCPDVPADPATFDWFGGCHLMDGEVEYTLDTIDSSTDALASGSPGGTGETTFDALAPGTYHLDLIDLVWCHAESNNVDDAGEVIVDGVNDTNVWIFLCDGAAGS